MAKCIMARVIMDQHSSSGKPIGRPCMQVFKASLNAHALIEAKTTYLGPVPFEHIGLVMYILHDIGLQPS